MSLMAWNDDFSVHVLRFDDQHWKIIVINACGVFEIPEGFPGMNGLHSAGVS